ncbi:feruloyl-CoA synthase [Pseudolabrys taiwanensis]|uniref:Feruloyl-CoA synthase n=1 Tax=Pseudolabrys taiwanensis TaxID=331696 RepID=A0A345ZYU9_9HYPH|nr:feruloyl-CoA synthase [Pseudolabrys taiwanensis]AXK82096.1 feruloyl-CoA synthase [Pseudolabrys taiwanensis]
MPLPNRQVEFTAAPLRAVRLGAPDAVVERRPDGTLYVRAGKPLAAYHDKISEPLEHWAKATPDRVFLAQRDSEGRWRELTYAQVFDAVKRIGASILRRGLSAERPIAVLSSNCIEQALLGLAAMYVGVPYAPISPAYSLMSSDFGKLRAILDLLTPGLVFANDGTAFARAIDAIVPADVEVVVTRNAPADRKVTLFAELIGSEDRAGVTAAHDAVTPDTIAKFLFTSGSTGTPKGVINTHRMMCSNQAMLAAGFPFVTDEPPVVLDWLPWSHTFGSNHNFNMVLVNGGSLYIDDGNPTPPGVPKTARNLREIAPTIYFNVPKGYEALIPHLRADETLRNNFFRRLKVLFYAGAALNQMTRDEFNKIAIETTGERVVFLSSLGSTETAPLALACTWDFESSGNIGLPAPGVELKLVPNEGKLEARLRGPLITPGYWRQAHLTRDAFDDEGFYKIGDALKFADPDDPLKGLLFDGRIAEDFKLTTGTWVSVGPLRARFIDFFAPYVRDVVFAGQNQDDIAALIFPDVEACRKLAGLGPDATPAQIVADATVRKTFTERLTQLAADSPGSSTRVMRALLMPDLPSMDKGEMTDKGSINQRAVLKNRAALVDELYAAPLSNKVIGVVR